MCARRRLGWLRRLALFAPSLKEVEYRFSHCYCRKFAPKLHRGNRQVQKRPASLQIFRGALRRCLRVVCDRRPVCFVSIRLTAQLADADLNRDRKWCGDVSRRRFAVAGSRVASRHVLATRSRHGDDIRKNLHTRYDGRSCVRRILY